MEETFEVDDAMRREAKELAAICKAMGDPTRTLILCILADNPEYEWFVKNLTPLVGLTQPTVSHHLRELRTAGLIVRTKRGVWALSTITPAARAILKTMRTRLAKASRSLRLVDAA